MLDAERIEYFRSEFLEPGKEKFAALPPCEQTKQGSGK